MLECTDGFELGKDSGGRSDEGGGHLQWVVGQELLRVWCGDVSENLEHLGEGLCKPSTSSHPV